MKNLTAKEYRTFKGSVFGPSAAVESGMAGYTVYVDKRGREYAEYVVFSLDVWGNEKDGFDVNDRQRCGVIWLPLDATDREIVTALKRAGMLKARIHTKSISVDGDEISMHVEAARTAEPLYQLEVA